ncbi:hypothetical protein EYZ11_001145 [Aspergillus tanneri]|uniref:Major facilitator superfamily (MFS) profile domain-containing protein n=1 Tax=Aspergillus tanneri TaxID=1220188 RepID=A0A4S3JVB9_9EURO|nr:hypothetical protein EYZ11_001145 [Aspergillus tanneri]
MEDLESQLATTTITTTKPLPDGYSLPLWRKNAILFIVSWMALAVTFSSTSLLPATPEIAHDIHTTSETLNVTNAGVLCVMGFSCLIWGPLNLLIGRRFSYNIAILFLVLGGLTGTSFLISGQTILADIFEPVVRGTAVGFFMIGTVTGPAVGPCIGGVIVTYASWRIIYWLQAGMTGFAFILSVLFVPDINQERGSTSTVEKVDPSPRRGIAEIIRMFNPVHIMRLLIYPNILLADLTCGLLSTFQYAILTSARSIFNPRFHLTTALVSGLFYLAPGAGFLIGSIVGGKLSDRTVRSWTVKRNGVRLPQDRLNSGLITLLGMLPVAALVYGWTLQKEIGGMVVPIVAAFFGGLALMGSFNSLNTYCAEALPEQRREVISGKYIIQYIFAAGSSALVDPVIDRIGVGWTFTICVAFSIIGGSLVFLITRWGLDMQRWVERRVSIDPKE